MARILGIDYGKKRTGLAATDPLQIIVSGIDTVETKGLWEYLVSYFEKEEVVKVVIGLPTHRDGSFTYIKEDIDRLANKIISKYPLLEIDYQDEYLSSTEAKLAILNSGAKKKKRRDKSLVDKVSAIIILQRYLRHI